MHIRRSMLLVCGPAGPLLDRIGERVHGEMRAVEDFAFEQALEHQAVTLLRVEPLPQMGESPPEPVPGSLASLQRAAEAPSVSRVVVVTPRADADGDLRRLRQSGARYVIVRPPPIIDISPLRGKRVLVPRDAQPSLITIDDLARAIGDVLADEAIMGQTIDVPPSGLAALEAAGAKPRVVAPWRAKLARWFRQPVLATPSQPTA